MTDEEWRKFVEKYSAISPITEEEILMKKANIISFILGLLTLVTGLVLVL